MPITVNCSCGKVLRVKDEMAGKKGKCPACGAILTIPPVEFEAPPMEFESPETIPPPPTAATSQEEDQGKKFDDYGVEIKEYKAREDVQVDVTSCPNCGADLEQGQDICLTCGTNVKTGQKIAVGPGVQVQQEKKGGTFNLITVIIAVIAVGGAILFFINQKKQKGGGGEKPAEVEATAQQAPSTPPVVQQKVEPAEQKQTATTQPKEIKFEMVAIPAGQFVMGDNKGEPDELPQRTVPVKAFMIDKYEVTNKQYKEFVDATGHPAPKHPTDPSLNIWDVKKKTYPPELAYHPVVNVSWEDANAYAKWAGKRLPTEIEWERAARYTDGRTYPWGNKFDKKNANVLSAGTQPVNSYEKGVSAEGVFNLAGNVWEWTADSYVRYPGSQDNKGNYSQDLKVIRGGSWMYDEKFARCANRSWHYEGTKGAVDIGFRCVKSGISTALPSLPLTKVLNFVEKQQSSWQDVSAYMRSETSMMGASVSAEGKIYYKRPNLMRNEAKSSTMGNTFNQLTVADGKTLWVETSIGGQVSVMKMDTSKFQSAWMGLDISNPFAIMTKNNMIDWQSANEGKVGEVPVYVLKGKLKVGSMLQGMPGAGNLKDMMSTFRLYIDQKSGFTRKIEMLDSKGNIVSKVEFSNIHLNTGLKDDLFKYKPPPGAHVQDMSAVLGKTR